MIAGVVHGLSLVKRADEALKLMAKAHFSIRPKARDLEYKSIKNPNNLFVHVNRKLLYVPLRFRAFGICLFRTIEWFGVGLV